MFVSDRIVFVELQKTGCTHIRNLLMELVGGQLVEKHNQVDPRMFRDGRCFLGSVRDPWDWYISNWAFSCGGQGEHFTYVAQEGFKIRSLGWRKHPLAALVRLLESRPNRHAEQWKRTFRDVNDAGAFREWLHMMHDESHRTELGEGYWRCGFSRFAD
ncbi:hypothetical protein ACFWZU_00020 [Frateuria sp. GZRR33]|uniref:hypothetical protein n=1 Tax=Frateuria sp. GZRR33 TaxID=3351535 RepID=UPI003EDC3954